LILRAFGFAIETLPTIVPMESMGSQCSLQLVGQASLFIQ
jgi:hypothetical protein